MKKKTLSILLAAAAAVLLVPDSVKIFQAERSDDVPVSHAKSAQNQPVLGSPSKRRQVAEEYGKLPIQFERNAGQTDEKVRYLARGRGYSLFLTDSGAVLSLRQADKESGSEAVLKMDLEGANASPLAEGIRETGSRTNYLTGSDPKGWRTGIRNYEKVVFSSVYEGTDLVYYGNNRELEFDFNVAPGSDPGSIRLRFSGLRHAEIDPDSGDLILDTGSGVVRQHKPYTYQVREGLENEVASAYRLETRTGDKGLEAIVTFALADYDRSRELVIDPVLVYGSYLGGSEFDEGRSVAVDGSGNAYIVGTAASVTFPTTAGTVKPVLIPRTGTTSSYLYDAFVTKVNADGTALVLSTFFGGRDGNETGSGVAVDALGNIYISGTTMSGDLPVVNAYQTTFGGTDDGFAAKLDPSGSAIIFSTYLGGNNTDLGGKVAIDSGSGDALFSGYASSPNFPTTPGAFKEKLCNSAQTCSGIFYSGSYLVRLSGSGSIVYSTLFDAPIADVAADSSGNAVVVGTAASNFPTTQGAFQPVSSGGVEGYIGKLDPSGSELVYGSFLGGGLQSDRVTSVALDPDQRIFVTGKTENAGFPTTEGAFDRTFNGGGDGFVTRISADGTAIEKSTFLGGTGNDEPFGIALAADGSPFVTGETTAASSFPLRNSIMGASGQIFLTRLAADFSGIEFSTMLGNGGAYDLATDASDNAYVTGHAYSVPVTPSAFQTVRGGGLATSPKDAFIIKVGPENESVTRYSISGSVTDQNNGFNNDYNPIVVTITGSVNRSITIAYNGGPYSFGSLPAGGTYTVSVRKIGYDTSPENVVFPNLGANQFADFTILRNRPPESVITTPQYGDTYDAPATINIAATATDPDGDQIVKMDFLAYSSSTGTIPLGTDTEAPYEFTWDNVPAGTWALYAVPTDSKGLRGVSASLVHVFVLNPEPLAVSIVSPAEGQSFEQGGNVPISVDVSSSVSTVDVKDQNGNRLAWLRNGNWTSEWRALYAGSYTITATAFDTQGNSLASAPVTFTVAPINHDISGKITDSLTGAPVANVAVDLVSTTNPSITASTVTDAAGNYSFSGLGTTPNDGVRITPALSGYAFQPEFRGIGYMGYIDWPNQNFSAVQDNPVTVSITSPVPGQNFPPDPTVTIEANAAASDGDIVKVDFYEYSNTGNHVLIASDETAPYSAEWANVPGGNHGVFARATSSSGRFNESSIVSFSVQELPDVIRLQGDVKDANGSPMPGITVRLTGSQTGTSVTNSFGAYGFFNLPTGGDYTITPEPAGSTVFTPEFFSVTNATADNYDIDFMASTVNQPPVVSLVSPEDGGVYTMPNAIQVSANATDEDGTVAHLAVSASNGRFTSTVGESNSGTLSVPWQPSEPGNYTLYATARDNGGLRTTVQISITVNPPPPVSITGRIVDRSSAGIEGVSLSLRNVQTDAVVGTAMTDATGNYVIGSIPTFASYELTAEKMNYSITPSKRTYFNISTDQTGDFTGTLQVQPSDFDGDGESDLAVWRPSTGVWHITNSVDGTYESTQFGGGQFGDIPVPGNYDGDELTDYAVYREGTWFVYQSSTGALWVDQWGTATDKPVQGDFDGDGRTDTAVWRPSNGTWYIHRSGDGGYTYIQFGQDGDKPLSGDFDGDGKTDITVWRPSNGVWYVLRSSDGAFKADQFGQDGDIPVTGDFDGDKISDLAVFRPSDGYWYVLKSTDSGLIAAPWGLSGDVPIPGDFDRDGKTDIGVFRPSDGNWYVLKSSDGGAVVRHFGIGEDIPVPAAYPR